MSISKIYLYLLPPPHVEVFNIKMIKTKIMSLVVHFIKQIIIYSCSNLILIIMRILLNKLKHKFSQVYKIIIKILIYSNKLCTAGLQQLKEIQIINIIDYIYTYKIHFTYIYILSTFIYIYKILYKCILKHIYIYIHDYIYIYILATFYIYI